MSLISCNTSLDCLTILNEDEILEKFCYSEMLGREETNFCDCPNDHGYFGDECDIPSAQTYLRGLMSSIILATSVCGVMFVLITGFQFRTTLWNERTGSLSKVYYFCLFLSLVSYVLYGIGSYFVLWWITSPEDTIIEREAFFGEGVEVILPPVGSRFFDIVQFGFIMFGLSIVTVCYTWLTILESSSEKFDSVLCTRCKRIKKVIFVVALVTNTFLMIGIILEFVAGRIFTLVAVGLGIVATAIYTKSLFITFLSKYMNEKDREDKVQIVEKFIRLHVKGLQFMLLFLVLDLVLKVTLYEKIPPGTVKVDSFIAEINNLTAIYLLFITIRFIKKLLVNQQTIASSS